ncbi:MAG: KEOPS complex subunit Cgi121 [Thermoprotei archaeon]
MAAEQLKDALRIVETLTQESNSLDLDYCISEDDAVINYVGSSLNPLCVTQVIPLKLVISAPQVRIPAILTLEAYARKENISNKPEIEYLLYLAGSRQIKQTLEKLKKHMEKPYLVIRFCEKTAEEYFKKLPREIKCDTRELENKLRPSIENIKEFYELTKTSEERLAKDILTLINNLKLQLRPRSSGENKTY